MEMTLWGEKTRYINIMPLLGTDEADFILCLNTSPFPKGILLSPT